MEYKYFLCCQKEPHFEKIKNGYKCKDCGKVFLSHSLDYNGKNIPFSKWSYQEKIRGRKADYIKIKNTSVFSTLETGKVNFMHIDDRNMLVDKTSIKVKKTVLQHKLNFNNTFLTITVNGVIDVYDMKTGEMISQLKTGSKYSEIEIFPLGKKGKWLYISTEKIMAFSCDFTKKQELICFEDILDNKILTIESVDCNAKYDYFIIHVCYFVKETGNNRYIKPSSFCIKYQNNDLDIKILHYGIENKLTYNFNNGIYYGISYNEMIQMDDNCNVEKICELPAVRSYSDGGGIFWVEEFIAFPEKLYFLTDNVIALRYNWEIVIFDVKKQEIITSIEGNLIQSFFIMGEDTICFSAGLNTYIVHLDLN